MRTYYVYILLCSDNSFYTGMTSDLERRLVIHKSGRKQGSYTSSRLPVELKWYLECSDPRDAIQYEKKVKGWSRRKKQALIDEK